MMGMPTDLSCGRLWPLEVCKDLFWLYSRMLLGNESCLPVARAYFTATPHLTMLTPHIGSVVDYIGSQSSGKDNEDNQHEGWGGARISGVLERVLAQGTLRQHPNVILLHAGTNDMKDQSPPVPEPSDDAPYRLSVLIDAILCECPDALLLVAKITGQRPLFANLRVSKFNTAIEGVVAERANKGSRIKLVDQSGVAALELADDLHPNDGTLKMHACYALLANKLQPATHTWPGIGSQDSKESLWSGTRNQPSREPICHPKSAIKTTLTGQD